MSPRQDLVALGAALRDARKAAGTTQQALADALGVSQNVISARELGLVSIDAVSLRRTLEVLGVDRERWGDFVALAGRLPDEADDLPPEKSADREVA